jgi:hypothetical protein
MRRLARKGMIRVERIPRGDHTFSRGAPREKLIERMVELLG